MIRKPEVGFPLDPSMTNLSVVSEASTKVDVSSYPEFHNSH